MVGSLSHLLEASKCLDVEENGNTCKLYKITVFPLTNYIQGDYFHFFFVPKGSGVIHTQRRGGGGGGGLTN